MSLIKSAWMGCLLAFALATVGTATQTSNKKAGKAKVNLPPAVAKTVADNRPNAEIAKVEVEKEHGVTLYDIEFKTGQGEIEVAEDGTIIDIETVVDRKDVPKPVLDAIEKSAAGARIKVIAKDEIRAEAKDGKVVKLAAYRYLYEADLEKGNKRAEVQVDPDGKVIEAPKWKARSAKGDS